MPLFSIVIATLNAEKTLSRCLDSLRAQTCRDFEVLLMDGGSRDATLNIAASYSDLPLKITSEPDQGLYDAMNKGILKSSGEWINIIGSDDELLPGGLQTIKNSMGGEPADIHAAWAWQVDGGEKSVIKCDICDERMLVSHIPCPHNAMFVHRQTYNDVGLYDLSYKITADGQWTHRAIKKKKHFHIVPKPVMKFYLGGLSSQPELMMPECYRIIRENFPCLSEEEAKYLLHMSKGWADAGELAALLARHPDEEALRRCALLARDYVPHCAQRDLDRQRYYSFSARLRSLYKKLRQRLRAMPGRP